MFSSPFKESIIKRAVERRIVEINIYDLRNFTHDRHKVTDDYPYGGGAGMMMKPEPLAKAIEELNRESKSRVILMTPQGDRLTQSRVKKMSQENRLTILCGRYEGIDERIRAHFVDDEISIGDYVLTGGEIPAMVIVDSITRLIPGVLEKPEATLEESFSANISGQLEYPQYTRPEDYNAWKVPEILLSGNHEKIENWRLEKAIERTKKNRPDLLKK